MERRSSEIYRHNFFQVVKAQIVANIEPFMITSSTYAVLRKSSVILAVSAALRQSLIFLGLPGTEGRVKEIPGLVFREVS
jgi:hypothetical protein